MRKIEREREREKDRERERERKRERQKMTYYNRIGHYRSEQNRTFK